MPAKRAVPATATAARRSAAIAPAGLIAGECRAGVLSLVLARPQARNSLSEAMLEALQDAIDAAATDTDVRAIVISGEGTTFCAGHDLKELSAHRADSDGGRAFTELLMKK